MSTDTNTPFATHSFEPPPSAWGVLASMLPVADWTGGAVVGQIRQVVVYGDRDAGEAAVTSASPSTYAASVEFKQVFQRTMRGKNGFAILLSARKNKGSRFGVSIQPGCKCPAVAGLLQILECHNKRTHAELT